MRLSSFILEAASLKELKVKYPQLSQELDAARAKGVAEKYFHWLANQRDLNPGLSMDALIEKVLKFDRALSTKRLDKLISDGKLPPVAKDIGFWSKATVDVPGRGPVPTLEAIDALEEKTVDKFPTGGALKLYEDGRVMIVAPITFAQMSIVGKGSDWPIVKKNLWDKLSLAGFVTVVIVDTDPILMQTKANRLALVSRIRDVKEKDWSLLTMSTSKYNYTLSDMTFKDLPEYFGKRWTKLVTVIKDYFASANYLVDRKKGDIWLGDKVQLNIPALTQSKVKGWTEKTKDKALIDLRIEELVTAIEQTDMYLPDSLDEHLSLLAPSMAKAVGTVTKGGVKWPSTKNKILDRILGFLSFFDFEESGGLPKEFKVVVAIDPAVSLKTYGLKGQPKLSNVRIDDLKDELRD